MALNGFIDTNNKIDNFAWDYHFVKVKQQKITNYKIIALSVSSLKASQLLLSHPFFEITITIVKIASFSDHVKIFVQYITQQSAINIFFSRALLFLL